MSLLLPGMHRGYGFDHWMIWKLLDSLSLSDACTCSGCGIGLQVGLEFQYYVSFWMIVLAWLQFLFVGSEGFMYFPLKIYGGAHL